MGVNGAQIGERWRLGQSVIPEVCCPRIPCGTFQGWPARPDWIKRFTEPAMLPCLRAADALPDEVKELVRRRTTPARQ